jgi:hypothetical protein
VHEDEHGVHELARVRLDERREGVQMTEPVSMHAQLTKIADKCLLNLHLLCKSIISIYWQARM